MGLLIKFIIIIFLISWFATILIINFMFYYKFVFRKLSFELCNKVRSEEGQLVEGAFVEGECKVVTTMNDGGSHVFMVMAKGHSGVEWLRVWSGCQVMAGAKMVGVRGYRAISSGEECQ